MTPRRVSEIQEDRAAFSLRGFIRVKRLKLASREITHKFVPHPPWGLDRSLELQNFAVHYIIASLCRTVSLRLFQPLEHPGGMTS
jgi:hypothetical protein